MIPMQNYSSQRRFSGVEDMCESTVYLIDKNGKEIKELALVDHRIVLEEIAE